MLTPTPAIVVCLLWAAVHSLAYLLRLSRSRSLLPVAFLRSRYSSIIWRSSSTKLTLNKLHLRLETTAWNLKHDSLAILLLRRKSWAIALTYFYNLGSVFAVLGMAVSLGILLYTCSPLLKLFSLGKLPNATHHPPSRRSLEASSFNASQDRIFTDTHFLTPIIPGLTVPITHLPMILIVVFIGQVIHEAGHAISAALESTPLLSAGASIYIVLPSAFVTLSSTVVKSLDPANRLRVVAAGPFHNLIFWFVLVAAGKTGLGSAIWSIPYKDVTMIGKVVVTVNPESPLHDYLPPGSLITTLDDASLGGSDVSVDIWTSYLTGLHPRTDKNAGWCVEKPWYLSMHEQCCSTNTPASGSSHLSCFASEPPLEERCLDPIPLLTADHLQANRCASALDCSVGSFCIRPLPYEQLLRITVRPTLQAGEEVILWRGPRKEIWEEVLVGTSFPRLKFLPLWLPSTVQVFFQYIKMATLSLYFFNLLPLPLLDGAQLIDVVLASSVCHATQINIDLEAVETSHLRRRKLSTTVIYVVTAVLFSAAVVFTILPLR